MTGFDISKHKIILRKILWVLLILTVVFIFTIAVFVAVRNIAMPPRNAVVLYDWDVKYPGQDTFYRKDFRINALTATVSPGIIVYTTTVSMPLMEIYPQDLDIVIVQPAFQAFELYVDGVKVGYVGDMESGRSNIWNGVFSFPIDKTFWSDGKIEITIRGYALYLHGFSLPPFLISSEFVNRYATINRFIFSEIHSLAIGTNLIVAISFLFMVLYGKQQVSKKYVYFAISAIFSMIFFIDHVVILWLPVSYLVYKKIIVISAIIATYFIHLGVVDVVENRKWRIGNNFIMYLLIIVGFIYLMLGHDMLSFKRLYTHLNISIFIAFLYDALLLLWDNLTSISEDNLVEVKNPIIFIGILINAAFVLTDVYQLILEIRRPSSTILISTYGLIIFMLSISLSLMREYIRVHRIMQVQETTVEELKVKSGKDPLTGVFNRNYLEEFLSLLSGDICFLMLDIDHFKQVNDIYGHIVGDEVLKHVVNIIFLQIRNRDIIIRYGGEEFLIILFPSSLHVGKAVAERIRRAIKNSIFIIDDVEIRITVSIGVSCARIEEPDKEKIWDFIKEADRRLYIAKEEGRDRVIP